MTVLDYKYDLALSFLARDEALATQLATELAERATVFLYSERQKELAGSDGLEEFTKVFGELARVCVVLYRLGLGATTWTAVEETAIKNRGMSLGWDFLLIISLDGNGPIWLPKAQLWLHWQRFGLPAAVAVIERKISESGGTIRDFNMADYAQKVGDSLRREQDLDAFLNSLQGVAAARGALDALFSHLQIQVTEIRQRVPQLGIEFRRRDQRVAAILSPGYSVTFGWSQQYQNVLRYSSLRIRELAGPVTFDVFDQAVEERRSVSAHFTLDAAGAPAWIQDGEPDRYYSSQALGDKYLRAVVDHARDEPQYREAEDND